MFRAVLSELIGKAASSDARYSRVLERFRSVLFAAATKALTGHGPTKGLGSTEMLHIYLSNRVDGHGFGEASARVPRYVVKLVKPREGRPGRAWQAQCTTGATTSRRATGESRRIRVKRCAASGLTGAIDSSKEPATTTFRVVPTS